MNVSDAATTAMSADTMVKDVGSSALPTSTPRDYWNLLKPNVMQLVVFSGGAALFMAPGDIHPILALTTILCIAAGAGASAAINNWYDADIDRSMARTAKRPTASGKIDPADALAMGLVLSILSVTMMGVGVNWLAAGWLAFTIFFYVVIYTMWLKRLTPQNIVIGGAAGAFPPIIGWAAVTGDIGLMPVIMFLLIFFWTPPHFWALAIYRAKDYRQVGVPMLPVVSGDDYTLKHMVGHTAIMMAVSLAPLAIGALGWIYLAGALILNARFGYSLWSLWQKRSDQAAMAVFKESILYLFGLLLLMMIDHGVLGLIA